MTIFQIYAETASPTLRSSKENLKDIQDLKDQIYNAPESQEDIVCLVYGACYVMSVDKELGIVWEKVLSTSRTLLALQLTFKRTMLAKKIDQSLFKKVIHNMLVL